MSDPAIVPDSQARGLLTVLPRRIAPYVQLMRLDRPIGSQCQAHDLIVVLPKVLQ